MIAYYNEIDPYAAKWLRNLIAAGHIAPGVVDERDIRDIRPEELIGFTQCHFFAGIGVWSHALRRAGWSDDRPIWTGSCPCQPFSAAGRAGGFDDERHLWPHWHWLIEQCRPPVVVGEQVASKDGLGWFDLVSADMEGTGYAVGASDLCAAGFSGAHLRQRLYFVGLADADRTRSLPSPYPGVYRGEESAGSWDEQPERSCRSGGLADADDSRSQGLRQSRGLNVPEGREIEGRHRSEMRVDGQPAAPMLGRNAADWLFCRDGKWRPVEPGTFPLVNAAPGRVGRLRAYGNALDAETATGFCEVVKEIASL